MKKNRVSELKELGHLIQQERKARKLTQTMLGNLSGTSINFISQVEAGKPTAQIGKVVQVLIALGIQLNATRGKKGLNTESLRREGIHE